MRLYMYALIAVNNIGQFTVVGPCVILIEIKTIQHLDYLQKQIYLTETVQHIMLSNVTKGLHTRNTRTNNITSPDNIHIYRYGSN